MPRSISKLDHRASAHFPCPAILPRHMHELSAAHGQNATDRASCHIAVQHHSPIFIELVERCRRAHADNPGSGRDHTGVPHACRLVAIEVQAAVVPAGQGLTSFPVCHADAPDCAGLAPASPRQDGMVASDAASPAFHNRRPRFATMFHRCDCAERIVVSEMARPTAARPSIAASPDTSEPERPLRIGLLHPVHLPRLVGRLQHDRAAAIEKITRKRHIAIANCPSEDPARSQSSARAPTSSSGSWLHQHPCGAMSGADHLFQRVVSAQNGERAEGPVAETVEIVMPPRWTGHALRCGQRGSPQARRRASSRRALRWSCRRRGRRSSRRHRLLPVTHLSDQTVLASLVAQERQAIAHDFGLVLRNRPPDRQTVARLPAAC